MIRSDRGRKEVRGTEHGVAYVDIAPRSRTAVLFHLPVRELTERRIRYLIDRQRPIDRAAPERHSFVPYDVRTELTQPASGWNDWSDGAERTGIPALLQQARLRGWGDADRIDDALHGWATFARERLITQDGGVRWGSRTPADRLRLYNFPWLAHFFADQYRLYGLADDLEVAARLLERSYELGAGEHLSIGQPEAVLAVASLLGDDRADRLRTTLREHAMYFATVGAELPAHEVNYEQSMVAPLVSLLALAHGEWPSPELSQALSRAVPWLRAFGGPQPHVRLYDIAIRHWDGYWFGRNRQWGDTFPHYWSVLTAVACDQLGDHETADRIFAANLVNFSADGSATCAFVMPSCVDGVPGYHADPLANDQDWALTLLLRSGRP